MLPITELMKQHRLIEVERDYERDELRRLSQVDGAIRKTRRGECWWPVAVGAQRYNSLNQLTVEVRRDATLAEVDHNFEPGKAVMFFQVTGLDDIRYFDFAATVSLVDGDRMLVAVPDEEAAGRLRRADRVGVQLSFDETTYRLMLGALERVMRAPSDSRLAQLRNTFYGRREPEWFAFDGPSLPWLNATQQQAVAMVLRAKDVAVVHGPPGTGKTTTLVEAIGETLRRENQVLVCAQSNMAVDWIAEQLADRGIAVLRVGNPSRVTDRMLGLTYERQYEAHPDYPQLWAMRQALRQLRSARHKTEGAHQKIERLSSRITELEVRIHDSVFNNARVIACTLAGSGNRVLEGTRFGTLFIDEAAQALEAACWIAIAKAHRVVLAGDHCQLPPTVKTLDALKGGLGLTLMERIVGTCPTAVTMLGVQYRMNEQILAFSNRWFYHDRVQSDPSVRHRSILDLDSPVEWIETKDDVESNKGVECDTSVPFRETGEQTGRGGVGRFNEAEAQLTIAVAEQYVERIGAARLRDEGIDIGIISPYRAQVHHLRHLVKLSKTLKPLRRAITVATVDGFQGQERDVIIISMVRQNEHGDIGFLRDLRRMNVAITRARSKLIIIGDSDTLSRHPFYRALHDHVNSINNS
ncbi:MAG: AAA family ATPase [Muribaculaceae bacterium]|nr:AAA family ATPase [Muribaculaceae bacterium]